MNNLGKAGENFLHSHPGMEKESKIPRTHVIVDRGDWEETVKFLKKHPINTSDMYHKARKRREKIPLYTMKIKF